MDMIDRWMDGSREDRRAGQKHVGKTSLRPATIMDIDWLMTARERGASHRSGGRGLGDITEAKTQYSQIKTKVAG